MPQTSKSLSRDRPYLSPEEVASLMGVSQQTVYNWIHQGEIEATKIGGLWRIPSSVITEGRMG
ncbi:helix-turn-helix domain-containing protein [Salinibacter ruber]|uniref:helix-turn-helix domain-containing protein n=1 Tax=Salinibacter ruber TaxID=146919 RepID=UPI003C6DDCCA